MASMSGQMMGMADWPKTIRFCKVCARETPHEIRQGAGLIATFCVDCIARALSYELDRD